MISAEREIRVEFNDCDPMGVVWNGRYFDYFEMGRSMLLESLGIGYMTLAGHGYMLPLVRNKAKYRKPLRPGQAVVVRTSLVSYDVLIRFRFEIVDKTTGALTTTGESVQMLTDLEGNGVLDIPDFIIEAIEGGARR